MNYDYVYSYVWNYIELEYLNLIRGNFRLPNMWPVVNEEVKDITEAEVEAVVKVMKDGRSTAQVTEPSSCYVIR